jgi:hypothetical protein
MVVIIFIINMLPLLPMHDTKFTVEASRILNLSIKLRPHHSRGNSPRSHFDTKIRSDHNGQKENILTCWETNSGFEGSDKKQSTYFDERRER